MNLAQQLDEALVEYVYDDVLKGAGGLVAECNKAVKDAAPVNRQRNGGTLRENTRVYLGRASDNDRAVIVIESDPPQTAPYNRAKKDFGRVDYANFTNARGRTAGWFDNAVQAVARKFGS